MGATHSVNEDSDAVSRSARTIITCPLGDSICIFAVAKRTTLLVATEYDATLLGVRDTDNEWYSAVLADSLVGERSLAVLLGMTALEQCVVLTIAGGAPILKRAFT